MSEKNVYIFQVGKYNRLDDDGDPIEVGSFENNEVEANWSALIDSVKEFSEKVTKYIAKDYEAKCNLYFLLNEDIVPINDLEKHKDKSADLIAGFGNSFCFNIACVTDIDHSFLFGVVGRQLSAQYNGKSYRLIGNNPDYGPNVMQGFDDGELNTGIMDDGNTDAYTCTDENLTKFLDPGLYK